MGAGPTWPGGAERLRRTRESWPLDATILRCLIPTRPASFRVLNVTQTVLLPGQWQQPENILAGTVGESPAAGPGNCCRIRVFVTPTALWEMLEGERRWQARFTGT